MALRKWKAEVSWWAESPGDDLALDDLADTFTDRVYSAIGGMEGVDEDTVTVLDIDTIEEEPA